jgi:hypothetical protein
MVVGNERRAGHVLSCGKDVFLGMKIEPMGGCRSDCGAGPPVVAPERVQGSSGLHGSVHKPFLRLGGSHPVRRPQR